MTTPKEICERLRSERGGATWYDANTGAAIGSAYDITADFIDSQAAEIERLKTIVGAHVQADAYRDCFPEGGDAAYLRKQETYWRLTARSLATDEFLHECAEIAKSRTAS